MRSVFTNAVFIVFLLAGFWYIYAGKGETMDTHTKLAATGTALPQIDIEQPKHTETATFALG
jgi:hypothetical protein